LSATDAAGAIDRYLVRTSPSHTLIQGIGYLELLFSDLATLVLRDYPGRLQSNSPSDDNRDRKLMSIILESVDRPEILDRIVEEKVRGITYGSPRDFFLKDSAGLRFSDHFSVKHQDDLGLYEELSARRNVWVHNDGRVDRKYLREVANSPFGLGHTASIPDNYLGDAMRLLRNLGTCVAFLTVQNNYAVAPRGELAAGFKAIHP